MPVNEINRADCTGCYACANICPRNCIVMKRDHAGFVYPWVDEDACIQCELCINICPPRQNRRGTAAAPTAYAAWSADPSTRFNSTSGGLFSELAGKILGEGGAVAGAAYDAENLVGHVLITDARDLQKIRQSKYVQSDANTVYRQVKAALLNKQKVLFCGTPCQVAALKAYLPGENKRLVCADFICRGVNAPKAYTAWLNELAELHHGKVKKVWFKYKKYGWKKSPRCTRIDFDNGTSHVLKKDKNLFMAGYLDANLYIRPSCGNCRFKGARRASDITLADFWGIDSRLDDDQGTSLVLVNTPAGDQLFRSIGSRVRYEELPFEIIGKKNPCYSESVTINPKSEDFYRALDNATFSEALKRFHRVPLQAKLKRMIARTASKLNVGRHIRRLISRGSRW